MNYFKKFIKSNPDLVKKLVVAIIPLLVTVSLVFIISNATIGD